VDSGWGGVGERLFDYLAIGLCRRHED
jgi:hypothetical protein